MANYKQAILKTNAYNTLMKDSGSGRLSHTYLLLSEDMEYCKQFAKIMAENILGLTEGSSGFTKLQKDIHPDVIILGQDEKITTPMVSDLSSEVYVRPYESDKKIYILLNMNDTNEEAQNKLLKTIEEPPASVFFILASKTERKLLQTVLSRSKKLELDLLSQQTISQMLLENGISQKEVDVCSACAGGVFSKALKMATDKEFLVLYQNIFKCLKTMNSSRDILPFASVFSQKNVNKEDFADLFMIIVRDVCVVKSNQEELAFNKHKMEDLKLIAGQFSLEALCKIVKYCLQLKEDLVYNTNINASVDEFLLKLVEVKVKCKK